MYPLIEGDKKRADGRELPYESARITVMNKAHSRLWNAKEIIEYVEILMDKIDGKVRH